MLVAPHPRAGARLPPGPCGDLADEVAPSRVFQVAQPVSDRIDSRFGRKLIDVELVGEGVRHGRDAPEPGCARNRRHVVDNDAMVGEVIGADRGSVAHFRHRRRRRDLASEKERKRRRGVGGIARREIVSGDVAARIESAVDIHQLGRALGLPLMLLLAGELHAHGARDRAREQRGVGGDVVRAVAPVATGGLHSDHLDLALRKIEKQRKVAPHPKRILRA